MLGLINLISKFNLMWKCFCHLNLLAALIINLKDKKFMTSADVGRMQLCVIYCNR